MSELLHRIFHADDDPDVLGSIKSAAPYFLDGNVVLQATSVDEALAMIPDALIEADANVPDDASYYLQWGPPAIDMEEAWDVTTDSSSIPVAIIDGGFIEPDGKGKRNGIEIANAIRESGLSVAILSLSADAQTWGDENASKRDCLDVWAEAIKRLFAK